MVNYHDIPWSSDSTILQPGVILQLVRCFNSLLLFVFCHAIICIAFTIVRFDSFLEVS